MNIGAFVGIGLLREPIAETAYVLAAERLRVDDTTVPLMARGGSRTARLWRYVRDDRPFARAEPPALVFRFSGDRGGEHPTEHPKDRQGILRVDVYAGYNQLYYLKRKFGPVASALCWSHVRRKFLTLADIESSLREGRSAEDISPIAFEAVKWIDPSQDGHCPNDVTW